MTQGNKQIINSDAPTRAETDRVWDAITKLTDMVQAEIVSTAELKAHMKDLLSKMDEVILNGTSRCADHKARIERSEYNIQLIDKGEHPACRACTQGIKNWVYATAFTALVSLISAAWAIFH